MTNQFNYTDERFADIQMLRYRLDGFENLTLRQKLYIYYLAKATLCGRDITTDQFGRYNLRIRFLLEAVYDGYVGNRQSDEFRAVADYLKRVWFANGIHHHYGCEKFVPGFTEAYFRNLVMSTAKTVSDKSSASSKDGIFSKYSLKLSDTQWVCNELDELCPVIFNPAIMPKRVNQRAGDDLVATSACNFYDNLTQKEVEDYYANMRQADPNNATPISYGLNSTLRRASDGKIEEDVWREGGLYGPIIEQIVDWLTKASAVAENDLQVEIIGLLIEYYRTGDLHVFDKYSIEWLKEHEGRIDFINGFIEVYGDPLGLKGSWEGIVHYKDPVATKRTQTLSANAQWFEDHSPVDPRFRKPKVVGVTANVVCAAMLGGDEYPSTAIGINLPNADWIRAQYGSKSITIGNLTHAYNQASRGNGFIEEFAINDESTRSLINLYGDLCDDLHTDLHECLGHGSGQLLPGVSADALGSYGSTIEEARADLFGLYYIADPKLVQLGLTPNVEAYCAQYYTYMMNGLLTQLTRIKPGHQIEEAHMRNRALITRWTYEHGREEEVAELVKRDGKTYVRIRDYEKLRELFGLLLREIQRIKSEGDYEAARDLVERYGVKIDPDLHTEILQRYRALHLSPYKGFINPVYTPVYNEQKEITDIKVEYGEAYDVQMLRYSRDYATLPYCNE